MIIHKKTSLPTYMRPSHARPSILVIYGPTGVGKTDFALEVASRIPAEIINMDVGQFYTPLTIGTAKPDWKSSPIPHHLFDVIDTPQNFTVTAYRSACISLINDIWARGKLPILVGGSGFYLKSLFFPPLELEVLELADKTNKADKSEPKLNTPTIELWQQLNDLDPVRATEIHKNDRYRIERALAIAHAGGMPSLCKPVYDPLPIAHATILFLTRDRKELYQRVDARVDQMMAQGWLDETRALDPEWESFIYQKKLIGYNELLDVLHGRMDGRLNMKDAMAKAVDKIKQRTRHYVKRQHTFWHMLEKLFEHEKHKQQQEQHEHVSLKLASINLTLIPGDLYINRLIQELKIGDNKG